MTATRTPRELAVEAERRRIFEDAQREADTVFAQYQLSQLLALGGELPEMAAAVISELVRDSDAVAGALWLAAPGARYLELVATEPPAAPGDVRAAIASVGRASPRVVPTRFAGAGAAEEWTRRSGWHGVALDERRDLGEGGLDARIVGFLALRPQEGSALPAERVRLLALVRHELAIAFRAAQLREALASEQALLAAILDGANDAIVAVDERRQVVRANPAALALLGWPPARQRTVTCRELLGCGPARQAEGREESLRCGPSCRFEQVMAGPSRVVECEQVVLGRDGTEVPVAASYSFMGGGEPGAVAVLRDLRDERAVEELRSSFLAAVSHELRTPLSLISGYVDSLLALDLDAATQRRSVERIGHAAARLTELVDELLELTHFESGGSALQRSRVHLSGVVSRLAGDLAESPGMRPVHVAIPSDLPLVEIDPVRIGHVLSNLVDNAQKYGGDGPITVTARRDRGMVVVTVHDRGSGIPHDERTRVFDRFYRGRDTRAGIPGSGLGLYVCRRLVEAHGGRIWVETEASGSAMSFSLPVVAEPGRARGGAG